MSLSSQLETLYANGQARRKYTVCSTRWEDCARDKNSCYGKEIADVVAKQCTAPHFFVDDSLTPLSAGPLSRVCQEVYAAKQVSYRVALGGTREAIVVRTRANGVMLFDYRHVGDALVVRPKTEWLRTSGSPLQQSLPDVPVGRACTEARDNGQVQEIGRFRGDTVAYAIPDAHGSVLLFGYDGPATRTLVTSKDSYEYVPIAASGEEAATGPVVIPLPCAALTSVLHIVLAHSVSESKKPVGAAVLLPQSGDGRVLSAVVPGSMPEELVVLNAGGVAGATHRVTVKKGVPQVLRAVRSENYDETVVKVKVSRLMAVLQSTDGRPATPVTVAGVLREAPTLADGLNVPRSLSTPRDEEEWCQLRIQAYVCPTTPGTEMYEEVYSYQTRADDAPTCVYTYHTCFGTSFYTPSAGTTKVCPTKWDPVAKRHKQFHLSVEASDKAACDAATYTRAENETRVAAGQAPAVALGPVGFPALCNLTMFCQWPVTVEAEETSDGATYRSLSSAMMASTTGYGSCQGTVKRYRTGALVRRCDVPGTITVSLFFSGQADAEEIVKQLDALHDVAGAPETIFGGSSSTPHDWVTMDPL